MLNDFFQEIDKAKTEAKKNYKMSNIKINQSQDTFAKATASPYLIDFKNIEIDKIWLEDYFKRIIFILEKFEEEDEVLAKNLKERFSGRKLLFYFL
jgi:RNAse (barnase) inhibitor barstar